MKKKNHILYDFVYMKYPEEANLQTANRPIVARGLRGVVKENNC